MGLPVLMDRVKVKTDLSHTRHAHRCKRALQGWVLSTVGRISRMCSIGVILSSFFTMSGWANYRLWASLIISNLGERYDAPSQSPTHILPERPTEFRV